MTQKALFCEQEGYAPMEGGCQLRKCLDAAVLEMMYREKATADVAFKYLFLRYRQNLLDWVKKNGCEQADEAQDIVHTVFTEFYIAARLHPIQLQRASLQTYLRRAVTYKWIDKIRKSGKTDFLEELESEELREWTEPVNNDIEKLRQLAHFSKKVFPDGKDNCSKVIRYYFFRLMSYEEILKTQLGDRYQSVGALRNRVSECSKRFIAKLNDDALKSELRDIYGRD